MPEQILNALKRSKELRELIKNKNRSVLERNGFTLEDQPTLPGYKDVHRTFAERNIAHGPISKEETKWDDEENYVKVHLRDHPIIDSLHYEALSDGLHVVLFPHHPLRGGNAIMIPSFEPIRKELEKNGYEAKVQPSEGGGGTVDNLVVGQELLIKKDGKLVGKLNNSLLPAEAGGGFGEASFHPDHAEQLIKLIFANRAFEKLRKELSAPKPAGRG